MSPGAACKCVVSVHACARLIASSPITRCQLSRHPPSPARQTFARGDAPLGCRGSFAKLEGKGRGGAALPPQMPGSAPKLVLQVQRPHLPDSSPASPSLGRREPPPKGLGAPDIQPPTWKVSTENHPRRCGGGGARLSGQGAAAAQAEPRLAGWPPRELSSRGTEPGCPCDCGVLWKRKLLEVSAKASRQREPEAGVRGETWDEHGGAKAAATRTEAALSQLPWLP